MLLMLNSSIKKTIKFSTHPKDVMDIPNNVAAPRRTDINMYKSRLQRNIDNNNNNNKKQTDKPIMNGKVIQPPGLLLGPPAHCASVSPETEPAMEENKWEHLCVTFFVCV